MPQPIMKTKKLDDDSIVTVVAGWIDTSFAHEFGTQKQGHYEVTNVLVNGTDIPLEILDSKFLEEMDDLCNT